WLVGRYVLMPDHIHLFCSPRESEASGLTNWVKYWKSLTSRQWPYPAEQPIWQKSFWDRQLRSEESYEQKWEYVRLNPERKGLVKVAEDWPFQGELNPF
ncbi:MAG: transposase, partial [Candidatus Omnitrophica bacterium]|nr:transposase [Candidatus Omnitrophota bacterium]